MSVFDLYSRYYDLLYSQKDYRQEAGYVSDELKRFGKLPTGILELGCGTARHAVELAQLGNDVHGIDLSESMLVAATARSNALPAHVGRRLSFACGDVTKYRVDRTFDSVISLFHVFCYQTSNAALRAAFATAVAHLKIGGLLAFDFWYGPAVLTQRPETRVRRLEDADIRVTRIAESKLFENDNRVDVGYTVLVEDKATGRREEISETHPMRYLFLPELDLLLNEHGLQRCSASEWLTHDDLSTKSWSGFIVARKVENYVG